VSAQPIPPGVKRVAIRWRDLDGFNHVNNAVFLNYLEEGRDAWLANALGEGITQMTEFVVRHIAIDFVSQLTQEDGEVEVTVEVERVGSSSITLRETITAVSDGRVAANATGVLVHTNPEHTESRPLPDDLRARLEASVVA
jgi:acyl-CoA thioester hydrolase